MAQIEPALDYNFRNTGIYKQYRFKVGALQRLAVSSCNPDAHMAALAAWHAAPFLVWSLFGPDCIDLVAERAGGGHRRRRVLGFKDAGIIPGNYDGTGLGWATFKLGGLAQRAGWYFAIIDAGSDFLVHWMSLAMVYDGCAGEGTPYANCTCNAPGQNLIFPGLWLPLSWTEFFFEGMVASGSTVVVPANTSFSGTISGYLSPGEGIPPPAGFEMRIYDHTSDRVYWQGGSDGPDSAGIEHTSGWFEGLPFTVGALLQSQYRLLNGGIFTGSWNVGGVQTPGGWPSIFGAPCASNIKSDLNWEEYWKRFLG